MHGAKLGATLEACQVKVIKGDNNNIVRAKARIIIYNPILHERWKRKCSVLHVHVQHPYASYRKLGQHGFLFLF